jgi:hypothetical protein
MKKRILTGTERVALHRQRRHKQGYRRLTVMLTPAGHKAMNKLANHMGCSKAEAADAAIRYAWALVDEFKEGKLY